MTLLKDDISYWFTVRVMEGATVYHRDTLSCPTIEWTYDPYELGVLYPEKHMASLEKALM